MSTIQELLKEFCKDSSEVSFRNDYSGRGMYGRRCVGITGRESDCMAVIAEVITDCHNRCEFDEDFDFGKAVDILLRCQSRDSMGLDVIIYWPNLKPIEEENLMIELHNADLHEGDIEL